jgi:hypothetical protein
MNRDLLEAAEKLIGVSNCLTDAMRGDNYLINLVADCQRAARELQRLLDMEFLAAYQAQQAAAKPEPAERSAE